MTFKGITFLDADNKAEEYIMDRTEEYIKSEWVDPVTLLYIIELREVNKWLIEKL